MFLEKSKPVSVAAGHAGGIGSSGCGFKEEDLTMQIKNALYKKLKEKGYNVIDATPKGKYSNSNAQLKAEVTNVNAIKNNQLHICIHLNCFNKEAYGTETWIYATGGNAEPYAKQVNKELVALGWKDRGIKVSGRSLCIPRDTNCPCVLPEICFIDNKDDMSKFDVDKVANALFKAVTGQTYSAPAPSKPSEDKKKTTFYRVVVDGKIIGSYSDFDNAKAEADKAMKDKKSKIELIKVEA